MAWFLNFLRKLLPIAGAAVGVKYGEEAGAVVGTLGGVVLRELAKRVVPAAEPRR